MKLLYELIDDNIEVDILGDDRRVVKDITSDSRKIIDGSLFVAIKGTLSDGHDFIDQAISYGAQVIVVEHLPDDMSEKVTWVKCTDSRTFYALSSAKFWGDPSKKLKVVGVTGTNGKTTVTSLLYSLFKELGYKVGLISTIEILINEKRLDTKLTTPDAYVLQQVLGKMVSAGCDYVFMEVSSHAVMQRRIVGISYFIGAFTNITHDHLDYHGTFRAYIDAKKRFFDELGDQAIAIVNVDDKNGDVMVQNTKACIKRCSLYTLTEYKGQIISSDMYGMYLDFNGIKFMSRLVGDYNAYNLLTVYAITTELKVANEMTIIERLSELSSVKGRMELVSTKPRVIVDFAHTPDALENVLKNLAIIKGKAKLLTVVGCGGDRDKTKRPIMAKIASHYSDQVIFTSDNPRNEDPNQIIIEMMAGLSNEDKKKSLEIEDRRMAIKTILRLAKSEDVVLIAGKGHEEYQEIKGKREYFSDQKIVKDILSEDI